MEEKEKTEETNEDVDAGYDSACDVAEEKGVRIPMTEGTDQNAPQ